MITSFDSLIGMNVRFWAKLLDMNTYTKDGSFSRRRIESASKIDPGADRIR